VTAPPRRAARPQPRPSSSGNRLASVFFGIGCLAVLGTSFGLGVMAGRRWPDGLPGLRGAKSAATAAPAPAGTRGLDTKDKGKPAADAPVLTFYRELTAPLPSAPPPPPRTARPEVKPAEVKPVEARPVARVAEAPEPKARVKSDTRFTVQVGAFKARAQAEAVRARLAEGGQEAYVSEIEAGGITQYRVRVGSYASREAANEAASRLATERQVATYVTTR